MGSFIVRSCLSIYLSVSPAALLSTLHQELIFLLVLSPPLPPFYWHNGTGNARAVAANENPLSNGKRRERHTYTHTHPITRHYLSWTKTHKTLGQQREDCVQRSWLEHPTRLSSFFTFHILRSTFHVPSRPVLRLKRDEELVDQYNGLLTKEHCPICIKWWWFTGPSLTRQTTSQDVAGRHLTINQNQYIFL